MYVRRLLWRQIVSSSVLKTTKKTVFAAYALYLGLNCVFCVGCENELEGSDCGKPRGEG